MVQKIIFLLISFSAISFAELPYAVQNTDIMENLEYLDRLATKIASDTAKTYGDVYKASTQTFTGSNNFTNPVKVSSTTLTVDGAGGFLDVGLSISSTTCTSVGACDTYCPSGKYAISCQFVATSDRYAYALYMPATNRCQVALNAAANPTVTVYALCARIKL